MRYVVTGAAGFIGSHLAGELQRAGHDVLGVDSYTDYYERARKERNAAGIDVLEADLADAALPPILAGADGVFHLAGQPGVRASWGESFELYLRRNVLATQRVFEAAADAGVRVVFASSSSVYGDAERYPTPEDVTPQPISPYGITKLACEQLAFAIERARGLESVSLRYFTVYGPRQRPDMAFTAMLEALARGETFRLFGDGSAARSFTYVGDAVAATIAAMERGRVGRDLQRRRRRRGDDERGDRARRAHLRTEARRRAHGSRAGRRPADEGGCDEGGRGAGLVAADRRSKRECRRNGSGRR